MELRAVLARWYRFIVIAYKSKVLYTYVYAVWVQEKCPKKKCSREKKNGPAANDL